MSAVACGPFFFGDELMADHGSFQFKRPGHCQMIFRRYTYVIQDGHQEIVFIIDLPFRKLVLAYNTAQQKDSLRVIKHDFVEFLLGKDSSFLNQLRIWHLNVQDGEVLRSMGVGSMQKLFSISFDI